MPELTILISPDHTLLVKTGDMFSQGDILAKTESSKGAKLNVAGLLKISPDSLPNHLVVNSSEKIKKDQLIAQKKGFFSSTTIKSPISGYIKLSKDKGFVIIKPTQKDETLLSPCSGEVVKISSSSVIIKSDTKVISGVSGSGNITGELVKLKEDTDFFHIDDRLKAKIVLAHNLSSAIIAKMKALGVLGVIVDTQIGGVSMPFIEISSISQMEEFAGQKVQLFNKGKNNYILI